MKKNRFSRSFQYNDNFKKWFWFVNETLVSAFVGALIAFVFGNHYLAALAAFGILVVFLIVLSAFFIFLENKISVLSIMNQGLKDGKFEDAIKFGSALKSTLFTSNKNEDIVVLGNKIDEAATKIENAHYNKSKGDYLVTVDGTAKSINQIRIGLKIDDLGWSMHLCKRTDEAVVNIIDGIKEARKEALRLSRINGNHQIITPFVQLILRGYRHLCGIYYEDVNQHWRAIFYENVSKLITSNCKIITKGGVCEGRKSEHGETTCGLLCSLNHEKKIECIRKNILEIYFREDSEINEVVDIDITDIYNFLNISHGSLMNEVEIEDDIRLYNMLPIKTKNSMVKEQCYAWGRNMVKKLQNGMYKQGEYDFISDDELSCKVAEARAFSQVYYYGISPVTLNDDFDNVIIKDILGKSELRYISLINEIDLVNLLQSSSQSTLKKFREGHYGRNMKVEKLIGRLSLTREIYRDIRADLYVRASIELITANYYEYNLNYRYLTNDAIDKSFESRKKKIDHYLKIIRSLRREINDYEHKTNEDIEKIYQAIVKDIKAARKKLKNKTVKNISNSDDVLATLFTNVEKEEYEKHRDLNKISSSIHDFSTNEILRLKTKWGAL